MQKLYSLHKAYYILILHYIKHIHYLILSLEPLLLQYVLIFILTQDSNKNLV